MAQHLARICHKRDPLSLSLCDDLSGEDHDNVSTNKESGGLSWLFFGATLKVTGGEA